MKKVLVSIDGVSGTGKSTVMRYLMGLLTRNNITTVGFSENLIAPQRKELADEVTRIRGLTDIDETAKAIMLDRAFTQMAASDRAYLSRTVLPIIAQTDTQVTVMDRWIATNMAYQSLNGYTPEEILEVHREMEVTEPDIYIILTCPSELAFERVAQRTTKVVRALSGKMSTVRGTDGKIDRDKSLRKMTAIQEQFKRLPAILSKKCVIVDTDRDLKEILLHISFDLGVFDLGLLDEIKRTDLGFISPYPFDHMVISG